MTREEAIRELKQFSGTTRLRLSANFWEALNRAIKLLEQEPCEDAISRKALIERINNAEENFKVDNMDSISSDEENPFVDGVLSGVFNIRQMVAQAPSCEPARKKGKWINKSQKSGCGITFVASECTCCGMKTPFDCDNFIYRYCPNCGAEMEGEE